MDKEELFHLIALLQVKGVGAITARNLIQHTGSSIGVFKEKAVNLLRISGIGNGVVEELKKRDTFSRAEKEIAFIEKNKIDALTIFDANYPKRLVDCIDAPLLLFFKGNANLNSEKIISIVGTRNASDYGKLVCEDFVEELSQKYPDLLVISGLAHGIDICAHRAALKNGLSTIGVVAHGLDRIYPASHRKTAVEMVNQGGLLTEYNSETNPDRQNFVMRNRIVAGMADALIVIESAERGGALITAEIANSYDKDVFAFPGKVTDTTSQGCNRLIFKNKASLIQRAEDFEELMGWNSSLKAGTFIQKPLFVELTVEEQRVVNLLQKQTPKQINILSVESDIPVYRLSSILLELEFKSVVRCFPGGTYTLS